MPLLLLLLVGALVELSVLVLVGKAIGVLPTLLLLVATAAAGSWLVRREGVRTLREVTEAARAGRPPTRELSDGVIIAAGGVLILVPGFVSDVFGLLCLLPPSRALVRRRLQRAAERRARRMEQVWRAQRQRRGSAEDDVIDGEVVSVSEDDPGRPSPHGELPGDGGHR